MPPDERIMKQTEIQKITNRYQDVNKNEVKFRGKIPVNIEYENNKQKMEILITERTDITPLLGMDWMKTFKLTIGRIQLAENNQSEKERVINKFPDLFENNETIKDTEKKDTTETRTFPGKTRSPTGTITPTRRCRKRTRKTNQIRTFGENKRRGRRLFRITGSNYSKKRQIGKNSTRLSKAKQQLCQNETTHAEHGGITKPSFGRDNTRPNNTIIYVQNRPGLCPRTNEIIRRN